MITSKIAANQTFAEIARISKKSPEDGSLPRTTGSAGAEVKAVSEDEVRTDISVFAANRLHRFNAEFNTVLKSVRIADQTMARIDGDLEQMESEVERFLKMYPPYPPGSEERVEMLKRYAGLRHEIEKMTLPKDQVAKEYIPAMGTLDIPMLGPDATDEQIVGAPQSLANTRRVIGVKRQRLSEDTQNLIQGLQK
ncbi:MAG: hypothetical protein ACOWWM_04605 [Desulfobacterales bacterium]